jgi:hypothetical protein
MNSLRRGFETYFPQSIGSQKIVKTQKMPYKMPFYRHWCTSGILTAYNSGGIVVVKMRRV